MQPHAAELRCYTVQVVHRLELGRFKRCGRAPEGLSKRPLAQEGNMILFLGVDCVSIICIDSIERVDNNEVLQYHYHGYYNIVSESPIDRSPRLVATMIWRYLKRQ